MTDVLEIVGGMLTIREAIRVVYTLVRQPQWTLAQFQQRMQDVIEAVREERDTPRPGPSRAHRAGAFCQWYEDAHQRVFGVGYMGSLKDYQTALQLVDKFTDEQLRDAALVWFGMDDAFARDGTRSVPKFASRITGCLQVIKAKGLA